jgi:hypothetical protein
MFRRFNGQDPKKRPRVVRRDGGPPENEEDAIRAVRNSFYDPSDGLGTVHETKIVNRKPARVPPTVSSSIRDFLLTRTQETIFACFITFFLAFILGGNWMNNTAQQSFTHQMYDQIPKSDTTVPSKLEKFAYAINELYDSFMNP